MYYTSKAYSQQLGKVENIIYQPFDFYVIFIFQLVLARKYHFAAFDFGFNWYLPPIIESLKQEYELEKVADKYGST